MQPPCSFAEFWPQYVRAHRHPVTRGFHFVGTLLAWLLLAAAIALGEAWLVLTALAVPYVLAWVAHFFVEQNRPASFRHPLWSLLADQRMVGLMLVGKMSEEVRRCDRQA